MYDIVQTKHGLIKFSRDTGLTQRLCKLSDGLRWVTIPEHTNVISNTGMDAKRTTAIPRHNGRVISACPKCGKISPTNYMIGTGFIKCKLCGHKVTAGRRDTAVIKWNDESAKKWKKVE